ncbi:MAG: DNA polymerase, partial [Candidatus Saccharimonadales bacterium]
GILLDSAYLENMSGEFARKIAVLERNIYAKAGQEFNIASPSQLAMILFEKLGLPTAGVKKGKTGYSTGASELDKLRALHPIVDLITQYREYTKLKSTYIDALPKLVDTEGKLHTTFALDVAATGRLSSHDPNLQNIPTRTELGQAIRTAFVPAEGHVFVSADYSQFELRLAACMADDKQMIADFNKDIDIHTATAAQVQGVPLDQVDKEMRRRAKAVNFGILYGMSPHGLSVATGMSLMESKDFIAKYFELRKPLQQYMADTADKALKNGYVETIFGRRRPTPDMKAANYMIREGAKRAAINMPIQGTEADLMKLAMLHVEERLDGLGEQLLQIHDSILVETPKANAEKVAKILKETMENVYKLPVKLAVDVKTGNNWGEL